MKAELMRELAEEQEKEIKAKAAEKLIVLLNNAICYALDTGTTEEEIASYLEIDLEMMDAIDNEDFEKIVEGE